MTSTLGLADDAAVVAVPSDGDHWTAYGYNIAAPASIWPMLELLHKQHFDWQPASASQRSTPIRWGDLSGNPCYEAETRAFSNEANFWLMVVGPDGKPTADPIEAQENAKMFAFVGNTYFADLVVRTTAEIQSACVCGNLRPIAVVTAA